MKYQEMPGGHVFLSRHPSAGTGAEMGLGRGRLLPLILQDFAQARSRLELMGFSGDQGIVSSSHSQA